MTTTITQVGDMFQMGNQSYDLETLIMALQMQRAGNIDTQLRDQSDQMRDKNAILARAQQILALARNARPEDKDGHAAPPPEYLAFVQQYGITHSGGNNPSQAEWDKNIENVNGFISSMNSSSQLDMIRLQSLMNKRNQAFEMMTNSISKISKNRDSIIGNMR